MQCQEVGMDCEKQVITIFWMLQNVCVEKHNECDLSERWMINLRESARSGSPPLLHLNSGPNPSSVHQPPYM